MEAQLEDLSVVISPNKASLPEHCDDSMEQYSDNGSSAYNFTDSTPLDLYTTAYEQDLHREKQEESSCNHGATSGAKELSSHSSNGDANGTLLCDTKLVVLHYLSSCSSSSESPSPIKYRNVYTPSPVCPPRDGSYTQKGHRSLSWTDNRNSNLMYIKGRRLRPRFHSSPASCSHQSVNSNPEVNSSEDVGADGKDQVESERSRPNLKLDVKGASNDPEFNRITPEEQFQLEIRERMSRTLDELTASTSSTHSYLMTPHTRVAVYLRTIGDRHQHEIRRELMNILHREENNIANLNFEFFMQIWLQVERTVATACIEGWAQIALALTFAQQLTCSLLQRGHSRLGYIADYTTQLIFDRASQFLIRQGGWGAVANLSPTNPLFTSSSSSSVHTDDSNKFGHQDNVYLPHNASVNNSEREVAPSVSDGNGVNSKSLTVDVLLHSAANGDQPPESNSATSESRSAGDKKNTDSEKASSNQPISRCTGEDKSNCHSEKSEAAPEENSGVGTERLTLETLMREKEILVDGEQKTVVDERLPDKLDATGNHQTAEIQHSQQTNGDIQDVVYALEASNGINAGNDVLKGEIQTPPPSPEIQSTESGEYPLLKPSPYGSLRDITTEDIDLPTSCDISHTGTPPLASQDQAVNSESTAVSHKKSSIDQQLSENEEMPSSKESIPVTVSPSAPSANKSGSLSYAEYRRPGPEPEHKDDSHLEVHPPVADEVNVSYPNCESSGRGFLREYWPIIAGVSAAVVAVTVAIVLIKKRA